MQDVELVCCVAAGASPAMSLHECILRSVAELNRYTDHLWPRHQEPDKCCKVMRGALPAQQAAAGLQALSELNVRIVGARWVSVHSFRAGLEAGGGKQHNIDWWWWTVHV